MASPGTIAVDTSALLAVLDDAKEQGGVRIKCGDGQEFVLRPAASDKSPLDVPGVQTDLTAEEIVRFVREGRERGG